ncbi:hypothetical protein IW152_003220, partial [Coemansia sp. BCRC 34962]
MGETVRSEGSGAAQVAKVAQVADNCDYNYYSKMPDPLRSLPVFTETLELGAPQWIQAGLGYLRNAGISKDDYVKRLVEKIEPRAMASYGSYLDTKGIVGSVTIIQLEDFLLTWNGNISTGAEYSLQLEKLQYTGGPIVKFNHEFSTLVNRNNLDANNTDTIYRYINKFPAASYVHNRLLEAKFDKLADAMNRAIVLVGATNSAKSVATRSHAIIHSGPEDMDVDRLVFARSNNLSTSPFLPRFEKFSHFCSKDEFLKLDQLQLGLKLLDKPISIRLADGVEYFSASQTVDVPLVLGAERVSTIASCVVVPIHEDILLGMSFLRAHHGIIRCDVPSLAIVLANGQRTEIEGLPFHDSAVLATPQCCYEVLDIHQMSKALEDRSGFVMGGILFVKSLHEQEFSINTVQSHAAEAKQVVDEFSDIIHECPKQMPPERPISHAIELEE